MDFGPSMKPLSLLIILLVSLATRASDFRGAEFLSITNFSDFTNHDNELTSKWIQADIAWDELVLSWNMSAAGDHGVEISLEFSTAPEVRERGVFTTWRSGTNRFSLPANTPFAPNGKLDTDTLKLAKRANEKFRAILKPLDGAKPEDLKFLGLSFRDSTISPAPLEPNKRAWGRVVDVRPRSQLDYPEGAKIWCSPTSTSMILDYWSQKLNRPELSLTVPQVAHSVYDTVYKGTGNWPFNTAFAGTFPGLRGYVTRLTDVSELEDWIEAGIPVATSVSYNRLKGRGTNGSGHLIVCVGFNETGDIVVNDPGTHLSNVRRTFSRDLFRQAWADSGNTVYIIYPVSAKIPKDRFGHWEN
jgi:hypothetical protein